MCAATIRRWLLRIYLHTILMCGNYMYSMAATIWGAASTRINMVRAMYISRLTAMIIRYLKLGKPWLHFSQKYSPAVPSVTFLLHSALGQAL